MKVRRSYFLERDFRRIRLVAVVCGVSVHLVLFFGLLFYSQEFGRSIGVMDDLLYGSSGGGGGEGAQDDVVQFGPQGSIESERGVAEQDSLWKAHQFTLLDIQVYNDLEVAKPVPKKEEPKRPAPKKKRKLVIAENLPSRWIRRGSGPGSGGGAGGGSGGGIGAGQGYSIDWGGTGSRRLLSGRLPKYPEGTDKQMAVILQFAVLPDGTVENIIPLRKTDELLEGAAITALRTWRFDPLPAQVDQISQVGKVTFNFKLE
jgi:TonB family protein